MAASSPKNKKSRIQRITRIQVKGYKSLKDEISVKIKPLTIIAGANSSGKSSLMEPLLLLKQTLEASGDPGALKLNGDHVKFTDADQLLHKSPKGKTDTKFIVGIYFNDKDSIKLSFAHQKGKGFDVDETQYSLHGRDLHLKKDQSSDELKEIFSEKFNLPEYLIEMHKDSTGSNKLPEYKPVRSRCFLKIGLEYEKNTFSNFPFDFFYFRSFQYEQIIKSILHLPGLRGNPQRTYPVNSTDGIYPGTFELYTASVIHKWQSDPKFSHKIDLLNQALFKTGLTSKVTASQSNDTELELKISRFTESGGQVTEKNLISIADVGLGVSQTLPVITALIAAEPGQLVFLEQPEIHLHPKAQKGLAEVIADTINPDIGLVVETHSSIFIKKIQTLVALGRIKPDDVVLYWASRNSKGETEVTEGLLDTDGAYGDWPQDFDDTELSTESDYLDAIEQRT